MKLYFWFLLLLVCTHVGAQTTISGVVSDSKGKSIPGANIFIKDSYDGATSDGEGKFTFSTTENGSKVLTVSFLGFQKWEQQIVLDKSELKIKIVLKEAVNELRTVTIAAGAFEASDEKKIVMLRPLDIVTTAGAAGDIYGAIQTLPGTSVVGEKEGLYVRGGDASETKTFIDGLMVDNPYFTAVPDVPQRGRFSPFFFKGTSFSSGGYSAQFGQAMSSALILESQDLPLESTSNIGIMSVGLSVGHSKLWKRTSFGVSAGYTDLSPYFSIFKQNRQWGKAPQSESGSLTFRHKTTSGGIIKAFINATRSRLNVSFPDTTDPFLEKQRDFNLNNFNFYSAVNYKEILFKKWTLYTAFSYSFNKDKIRIDEFPLQHRNNLFDSRLMLSHSLGELSVIRFGGQFQKPVTETTASVNYAKFRETYTSFFGEGDIYLTTNLVARAGVRIEHSEVLDNYNASPRLSLAFKTGKLSQVSFAYGDFYQAPQNEFLQSYATADLQFEKATHFILNYQHISEYRTFRIETYIKDYNDLVRFQDSIADNSGYGTAKGFELFYRDKKTISRSDFWISYSFLETKRLYRDFPIEAMPAFAAKHTASLVFKYFIPKISLAPGFTYVYSSGRPYYNPNNPVYLADRTKDYHNLSINFSYLTSIRKNFTVLVLSISNALGIEHVFSYYYSSDGTRRIAIGPTAPRFVFAGVFINIGSQKDDSDKYN